MSDVAIAALGGSAMAAIIGLLGQIVMRLVDRRSGRKTAWDARLSLLETAQRASMRDRIRCLGRTYVKAGHVALDEREDLFEMHAAYHGLGGNGNLDSLMADVMALPLEV